MPPKRSHAKKPTAEPALGEDPSLFQILLAYPDEASAARYFENLRWPNGRTCTKCHSPNTYDCHAKRPIPLYKCNKCGHQFTVTSGSIMDRTHLPLRKWLMAFHLVGGAKKGISSRQMARTIGVTLKSAWFLEHRIRETMKENRQFFSGGTVEADETYIGGRRKGMGRGYRDNKVAVMAIVERAHEAPKGRKGKRDVLPSGGACTNECPGRVQSMALTTAPENITGRTVAAKLRQHTDPATTRLMTDESPLYDAVGKSFASHETVNHSRKEYVRVDDATGRVISTNAAEGFFGNLKRQINGTHHSTSKKHLPRYLEEHDFKYNTREQTDVQRTEAAIGKLGETEPLHLYRTESGHGNSLIEQRQKERRDHGTVRGFHNKRSVKRPPVEERENPRRTKPATATPKPRTGVGTASRTTPRAVAASGRVLSPAGRPVKRKGKVKARKVVKRAAPRRKIAHEASKGRLRR